MLRGSKPSKAKPARLAFVPSNGRRIETVIMARRAMISSVQADFSAEFMLNKLDMQFWMSTLFYMAARRGQRFEMFDR